MISLPNVNIKSHFPKAHSNEKRIIPVEVTTVTEFYNMEENLQQQEKMARTDKFPMIYNLLIGEG